MARTACALGRVYQLLEPGPVVLVTTAAGARRNVMTLSWHLMMEFEPPTVGFVLSEDSFSFGLLMKSRECVINIPTRAQARAVVVCGNRSGRDGDKFSAAGLTPVGARQVGAPLIEQCYASLECRVTDVRGVRRYNFFVVEVVRAWVDRAVRAPRTLHHRGWGRFMVAGPEIRLRSRMR
ncbi:MAG: flavin reductase family protein [Proteobacteria bacterium]|nr:flavin reductase family protein [Pseudomonadota bacterium]